MGFWCSSEPSVSQFSSPTEPGLEKEVSSFRVGGLNQLTDGSKPTEGRTPERKEMGLCT